MDHRAARLGCGGIPWQVRSTNPFEPGSQTFTDHKKKNGRAIWIPILVNNMVDIMVDNMVDNMVDIMVDIMIEWLI